MTNTLFMETTKIDPEVTIGEIQRLLARYDCQAIMTEFKNNEVEAVSFRIEYKGCPLHFKLPARAAALFKVLNGRRDPAYQLRKEDDDRQHAKRVAWRQILRWVQAQLALVQTEMVTIVEVFLPYASFADGKTLYQRLEAKSFTMLTDQRNTKTVDG